MMHVSYKLEKSYSFCKLIAVEESWNYLSAYRSVLRVLSHADCVGDTLAIMHVREFPTNESFKICVNLLCLNGVWRLSWSMDRMHSFSWNQDIYLIHQDSMQYENNQIYMIGVLSIGQQFYIQINAMQITNEIFL